MTGNMNLQNNENVEILQQLWVLIVHRKWHNYIIIIIMIIMHLIERTCQLKTGDTEFSSSPWSVIYMQSYLKVLTAS